MLIVSRTARPASAAARGRRKRKADRLQDAPIGTFTGETLGQPASVVEPLSTGQELVDAPAEAVDDEVPEDPPEVPEDEPPDELEDDPDEESFPELLPELLLEPLPELLPESPEPLPERESVR